MTETSTVKTGVLVIDDDEANRIVLEKLFAREKIQAAFAENGREGMALARKLKPDLILLDIFMPGEDGFEILKQMKADPGFGRAVVIIFSILTDPAKIEKAYALGADGYIPKPFNMTETVDKVKAVLAKGPDRT